MYVEIDLNEKEQMILEDICREFNQSLSDMVSMYVRDGMLMQHNITLNYIKKYQRLQNREGALKKEKSP